MQQDEKTPAVITPGIIFVNPELTELEQELSEAAKARFDSLDSFNADCKALTRKFKACGVPPIRFVKRPENDLNGEEVSREYVDIAWHDQAIVYKDSNDFVVLRDALPVYQAPADVRARIRDEGLLVLLMQAAIDRLKKPVVKIRAAVKKV